MDPEVKKYFIKIMNSFSMGLLWLFSIVTIGLYFNTAIINYAVRWYNIAFYIFFILSFSAMIRYYYKVWKS